MNAAIEILALDPGAEPSQSDSIQFGDLPGVALVVPSGIHLAELVRISSEVVRQIALYSIERALIMHGAIHHEHSHIGSGSLSQGNL